MEVKIKLIEGGKMPTRAHESDAGLDCYARKVLVHPHQNQMKIALGFAVEIPEGHVGLLFPRSSICNTSLRVSNCVGVIDAGYRGELSMVFDIIDPEKFVLYKYKTGDRVGQLIIMPYPKVELKAVESLGFTDRNTGGYGSSGK